MTCVPANKNALKDEITVGLADLSSGHFDDFTLFGRDFSLDQHIGNPGKVAPFDGEVLACPGKDQAITGLTYDATHTGAMHDLHIECIDLP